MLKEKYLSTLLRIDKKTADLKNFPRPMLPKMSIQLVEETYVVGYLAPQLGKKTFHDDFRHSMLVEKGIFRRSQRVAAESKFYNSGNAQLDLGMLEAGEDEEEKL